jgi:hypothetical protein
MKTENETRNPHETNGGNHDKEITVTNLGKKINQ